MERVSIQEASRRLNLSQAEIRRYAREGELKAFKEGGPNGTGWVIELPEEGWLDDAKQAYMKLEEQVPRWWWPNRRRTGEVHYIDDVGIEGERITDAWKGHHIDNLILDWGPPAALYQTADGRRTATFSHSRNRAPPWSWRPR